MQPGTVPGCDLKKHAAALMVDTMRFAVKIPCCLQLGASIRRYFDCHKVVPFQSRAESLSPFEAIRNMIVTDAIDVTTCIIFDTGFDR